MFYFSHQKLSLTFNWSSIEKGTEVVLPQLVIYANPVFMSVIIQFVIYYKFWKFIRNRLAEWLVDLIMSGWTEKYLLVKYYLVGSHQNILTEKTHCFDWRKNVQF